MNSEKKKRLYLYCIVVISILLLLPLLRIGFYNHPTADDYGYSATTYHVYNETHSIPLTIKEAFDNSIKMTSSWQGLYTAAFVQSLQPAILGVKYYAFTSIISIAAIWIPVFIFSYYVLCARLKWDKLQTFSLASIICTVMTQFLPSAVEGLYWFNGAMNYTLFWGMTVMLMTIYFSFSQNRNIVVFCIKVIIAAVLAFLISGGNYVPALGALLVEIVLLVIFIIMRDRKSVIGAGFGLLFGIAGFYISISSPGVAVRQGLYEGLSPISAIFEAIKRGTEIVSGYWNGTTLFFIILSLPLLYRLATTVKDSKVMNFSYPAIVVFVGHMLLCALLTPPLFAMGYEGEGRLLNVVYLYSIIVLFFDVFYIIGYILACIDKAGLSVDISKVCNKSGYKGLMKSITCIVIIVIFGCCMLNSWAYTATVSIVSGEAKAYEGEMYFRHNLLMEADEEVVLPVIRTKPEMLYHGDIADGPDTWPNTDLENYYGVDRVYLETYFMSENK